jgi:hypothetical protein
MVVLRFEPIAQQLGKLASPALLFPTQVLEQIRKGDAEQAPDGGWSPAVREFMGHFMAVVRAGKLLLGAPAFERLARLQDELAKVYMPGGPPMSPVYDSYAVQHVLGEIPQGLAGETPYTVLAQLSKGDPARARLQQLAESLAGSHLDLYRVARLEGERAELLPVRGGDALTVLLTGPFLREDDFFLGRALAFDGAWFMADSPYLLQAPEREWLEYLDRAARPPAATPVASGSGRPLGKPKLTPKQVARRRQEQKRRAALSLPAGAVVQHLQHGPSERFWLDYFMDGYAGERRGIVRLAGVPDRPETLPHADRGAGWSVPNPPDAGGVGGEE